MIPLYRLKNSDDIRVLNGLEMDKACKQTMAQLNLKFIRSVKNRDIDRVKAIKKYSQAVNLKQYAIHHCFNGLVGLVPRKLHSKINHCGYFYRLKPED